MIVAGYIYFILLTLTFGALMVLHWKEAKKNPFSDSAAAWCGGCGMVVVGSLLAMFMENLLGGFCAILLFIFGLIIGVIFICVIIFDMWAQELGIVPEGLPSLYKLGATGGLVLLGICVPFSWLGLGAIFLGGFVSAAVCFFMLEDLPSWAEKIPFIE